VAEHFHGKEGVVGSIPTLGSSNYPIRVTPHMKRLVRKEKDKKITGLCAGIAEYLDVDVTVVRRIVVVLTLTTWLIPMVLAYLIASSITPKEGEVN
jgi:phage shock protein C